MTRKLAVLVLLYVTVPLFAQQGPPPEIRARIDAFIKALNGTTAEWEQMAQENFAPDALKARSPEDRRRLFERLKGDFGQISVGEVRRRGPDAPLLLSVEGSTKLKATLTLQLQPSAPFKFTGLGVEVGGGAEPDGPAAPTPKVNGGMADAEIAAELDRFFTSLTQQDLFSGAVLVARDGKPIFRKGFGWADRANRRPNTPETRFNLGSINKTFTHTAIDQLVAQGKLSHKDTVGAILPDYPQAITRSATIDQLLNHTAGIADFFGDEFSKASKQQFRSNEDYYRLVSSLKPTFAPGAENRYCNGCYITLGQIIAKVGGVTYETYIQDNIYKPAGMTSSGWPQSDGIEPDVAIGYTRRAGDEQLRSNILMHGAAGSAAGGGYSTVDDLLAFDRAMRAGKLVKRNDGEPYSISVAGGAPGVSAVYHAEGPWTVVVLTNLDPRTGEDVGRATGEALSRRR